MWLFKKKFTLAKFLEIRDWLEENADVYYFEVGPEWDDMKPGWDYLRKHNPPSICPYVPTSWYIQPGTVTCTGPYV